MFFSRHPRGPECQVPDSQIHTGCQFLFTCKQAHLFQLVCLKVAGGIAGENGGADGSWTDRILFLDDDDLRATAFLASFPQATRVKTAEECIRFLEKHCDIIRLDHDLDGEVQVDSEGPLCGMEVV